MTRLDLSIIIVSFNTKQLLKNCLTSIYAHTRLKSHEIIVVDNASKDGSSQMVEKIFPQVRLLRNKKNVGFGQANNQATKVARGKNLLFLNSDTSLTEDSISIIVNYLKNHPDVTIAGCLLKNIDGSTQQSAGFFPTLSKIFFWALFLDDLPIIRDLIRPYQISSKKFYEKEQEVDWVTGAFFLLKKQVFDHLGGFDKNLFMYGEEVDLCYRAKKKGFKVSYTPKTNTVHYKSASSESGEAIIREFKFLIYFFKKYKNKCQLPLLKFLLKIACLSRVLLFGIIMGKPTTKKIYEKTFKLV